MADILALRTTLRADQAALDAEQQKLDELIQEVDDPELPPSAREGARRLVNAQGRVVTAAKQRRDAAQADYNAALQADPMHSTDAGLPLVLLPVRIETAYLPGAAGTDLVVRIYPDDIHVDSHEPELTSAELAAGAAYWKAVWGAGPNQGRLDAAWKIILGRLKPSRAAWAVHVLTPSVPRPTDETPSDQPQPEPPLPNVGTRAGNFTRAAHTTLLPDHWHVLGFRGGNELFNVDGSPIPDTLNVTFGPPGTGAESSDLPFDQDSRWLVDLDAAIAAGMALRIPFTGPDFATDLSVDQLFVVGVSSQIAPADAASRLETALIAHQYTNGLGFLPPGTPTNNTSATRSAWQSAPVPPSPSEVDSARSQYQAASKQNAAMAANAFGVDGAVALSIAENGLIDQQTPVQMLQFHLWNALEGRALYLLYQHWDPLPPGSSSPGGWHLHDNPTATAMLHDHVMGWVRCRGTLPVLRVGNQPYGLLPASSLADWVTAADDPTTPLVGWLRSFLPYFQAAVGSAPRIIVGADQDPDVTTANVLKRVPVSDTIMLRQDGDPLGGALSNQPLPAAPIPGLPVNSELFFSTPADTATPMPIPMVVDADADHTVLVKMFDLFSDSMAVIEQTMTHDAWVEKYQSLIGQTSFPGAPPPDLFISLIQDSWTDPGTDPNNSVVAFLVLGAFFFEQVQNQPEFQQKVQQLMPLAKDYLVQFAQLCALSPENYEPVLRELLDIASHRFDAWVTSLFSRRLDQMRAAKPAGIVLGAYGWVEDLAPRGDLTVVNPPPSGFDSAFSSDRQKYVHAPSLHHAATAAVLRAGYESHPDPDALAVNLQSARVRTADWLAEGVRNGQTVGALLGYRFERALHDAELDAAIEGLRVLCPLPLLGTTDGDVNSSAAREAIAARNVVDGLQCVRRTNDVLAQFQPGDQPAVSKMLADLGDALDAFGDLLLAESVHHLVGGNPLRASLSADSVGRGEQVPDRFDVVRTPRSGRPLTWQVGALLPAAGSATVTGWNATRPRAKIEPHVEAWVESILGNASLWQISCKITSVAGDSSTQPVGLDTIGICALDVIAESSGESSVLERRIADAVTATQPAGTVVSVVSAPASDGSLGFDELIAFAARIRLLLAQAVALGPQHVQGPDAAPSLGIDANELASRVSSLQSSLSSAASQLAAANDALTAAAGGDAPTVKAAVQAGRAALLALADVGILSAYPVSGAPDDPDTVDSITSQTASVLAAVQTLAAATPPTAPAAGATPTAITAWVKATSEYVQSIVGKAMPLLPTFLLPPDSPYAASLAPGAVPVGADQPTIMAWLRRLARVRPNIGTMHDVLLASESLTGSEAGLTTTQLPVAAGARWIGLPFGDAAPPKARLSVVLSTPLPIDPSTAFCGLLFDTWTEQLPGLTSVASPAKGYESSEVTGVAFTVDAPDAYPPQAILLAVAPDPAAGWSLDVLSDVLTETLNLAKIRTVDLGDLPRLNRVLPGLHSGSNLDTVFVAARVT
jgi:hypothetical protein